MSLRTELVKLKDELDNGNLPYYKKGERNFLDSIDPLNKNGVFSEYISFLEKTVNDRRFASLSKSQRSDIKKELSLIKQEGESRAEEMLVNYGLSFKNAKQQRNILKDRMDYEPVLVLNPDTGIPEWDVANITNLTPKAKSTNGYETFKINGENGKPLLINIKGIPENYDIKEILAEKERHQIMDTLDLGNDFESLPTKKQKQINDRVDEDLKGIDSQGVRFYYHFPNGNIVMIDKSGGDRSTQNPQNGQKISFKNPITQEDDFYTEITYNPRAKETYDTQKEVVKNSYRKLLGRQSLTPDDDNWIEKQLNDDKPINQVLNDITNLPEYIIRQKLGQSLMSMELPEVLEKRRMELNQKPIPLSTSNQSQVGPTPTRPEPIGLGGPGTVPNASMVRPGETTERMGGLSSLSDVKNLFKNLRL